MTGQTGKGRPRNRRNLSSSKEATERFLKNIIGENSQELTEIVKNRVAKPDNESKTEPPSV